eukprot:2202408-Alexandrium_andersonii.AAC.1
MTLRELCANGEAVRVGVLEIVRSMGCHAAVAANWQQCVGQVALVAEGRRRLRILVTEEPLAD